MFLNSDFDLPIAQEHDEAHTPQRAHTALRTARLEGEISRITTPSTRNVIKKAVSDELKEKITRISELDSQTQGTGKGITQQSG